MKPAAVAGVSDEMLVQHPRLVRKHKLSAEGKRDLWLLSSQNELFGITDGYRENNVILWIAKLHPPLE